MLQRFITAAFLFLCIVFILSSCVRSKPPVQVKEEPATPLPPPAEPTHEEIKAQQAAMAALPPPTDAEVTSTVQRVYKNVVIIQGGSNAAVVGDFNGDVSQDIAVVVKPAPGKLSEINDEMSNWILGDVLSSVLPDSLVKVRDANAGNPAPQLPHVVADDLLLAVFHGHEAAGWRNPEAQQSYLLKHAVGSGMKTATIDEVKATWKAGPSLQGDVITQKLGGENGFLFYGRGVYNWFDPKRYKARPARMAHIRQK